MTESIFIEKQTPGVERIRVYEVVLSNPESGEKRATIKLEKSLRIGDTVINTPTNQFDIVFNEETASTVFKILNPINNEEIGEQTFQEYFVSSYSLAITQAEIKMAEQAAQEKERADQFKLMETERKLNEARFALQEKQRQEAEELFAKQEAERLEAERKVIEAASV